jgi:hypothetical protein
MPWPFPDRDRHIHGDLHVHGYWPLMVRRLALLTPPDLSD